ncbi:sphingolipid delta(4)-desaturase [[Candida] jaroonii]|uniref:Sphingolipid delta(4)-desaturase n=1 Tax=[Candida] jaroonii TaxID=467808 RepID=A0ACA9YCS9_9ASCO|nr:sphingolipid delta(4)-desaturase [[Candida] jaroonii]
MSSITHRKNNETYTFVTPAADSTIEKLNEFYWTNELEPHVLRRKAILAKHPEVKKLIGHEPLTKYLVLLVLATQLYCCYALRNTHPFSWRFILTAYAIGATANQNIFLAIHELSHNLLFRKPLHNKLFAVFVNFPIGIPYSASFQPYHQLHHKFLGDEYLDTDLPTRVEGFLFSNVLGKVFFTTCQILFYALRPMFVTQIKFTYIHLVNVVYQFGVDYLIVKYWGWYSMSYFIMSSFLAGSWHPCAGHFIAEHYVLNENNRQKSKTENNVNISKELLPEETYSYYGSLNHITWNVGYHNEHHDFPYIAWTKLPELNRIAKEFYDPLPKVNSWVGVIVWFILNDVNDLWNRVKRSGKQTNGSKVGGLDSN